MKLPIEDDTALVLEVWDENMFFDTLVGKTETSLDPEDFVHSSLSKSGNLVYKFEIIDGAKKEGVWETALGDGATANASPAETDVPEAVSSTDATTPESAGVNTAPEAVAATVAATEPVPAVEAVSASEVSPPAEAATEAEAEAETPQDAAAEEAAVPAALVAVPETDAPSVADAADAVDPAAPAADAADVADAAADAPEGGASGVEAPSAEDPAAEAPSEERLTTEKTVDAVSAVAKGGVEEEETEGEGLDYSTVDQEAQRAANRKKILNKKGGRGRGRGRGKK
jgi:hypothetical protein